MTELDLDAISDRHDDALLVGRKLSMGSGEIVEICGGDVNKLFACCADVPDLLVEIARLHAIIKDVEKSDSLLCNCDRDDCKPTNNGVVIDHHCECPAVMVSAAILGSHKYTKHADQCVCGDIVSLSYDKV